MMYNELAHCATRVLHRQRTDILYTGRMESVAARLKALRESANPSLSVRKMAEELGYGDNHNKYNYYEKSYGKPALPLHLARDFADVLEKYGVDRDDVMSLASLPDDDAPPPAVHSDDDVEIQQWDVAYGMGAGGYLDLPVTGERHKFSRSWLRQFTSAPPEKVFLADGTGDSMFPTILDADKVMIDTTQREVRMADRIWAAAYGNTGIIKRLRPSPDGSVKILSDNPSVPPEVAFDGELFVVGRVVAIVRKT